MNHDDNQRTTDQPPAGTTAQHATQKHAESNSMGSHAQLAAARDKLAASGKSPRQIEVESKLRLFEFIYRFGFTSASLILLLLERTSAGFGKRLVKQGWLVATKTESGVPRWFYTLSELGLQEAERRRVSLLRYPEITPYAAVDQQKIRHDLIAQDATVRSIRSGIVIDYMTVRMIDQDGNKLGEKIPDVVWMTVSGLTIAVEVELSSKWDRDLDQFVLGILRALDASKGKPRYDRFAIVTDSPAIQKNYQKAIKAGATLRIWQKDQRKHWVVKETIKVPDWLATKIDFHLLEE